MGLRERIAWESHGEITELEPRRANELLLGVLLLLVESAPLQRLV
jgi:hypothetical protein